MRLTSTSRAGRARRKFMIGTSDWPPARTFESSSSSASAASTLRGASYSNAAGFIRASPSPRPAAQQEADEQAEQRAGAEHRRALRDGTAHGAADVERLAGRVGLARPLPAELALEPAGEVAEDRPGDVLHEVAPELRLAAGDLHVGLDDDVRVAAAVARKPGRDRRRRGALPARLAPLDAVGGHPVVRVGVLHARRAAVLAGDRPELDLHRPAPRAGLALGVDRRA